MEYQAPLTDMQFLLHRVFRVEELWAGLPSLTNIVDRETADAILGEGAKLCAEVIAPLNRNSDEQGAVFDNGSVSTPDGFAQAYRLYCEGGWGAISGDPEYGGMGMPKMLQSCFEEMSQSGCISFTLHPMLTAGASLSLSAHGSEQMKQTYLPSMYAGQWAGTMCLTEAHAGSDLGIMTSKAEASEGGSFRISGTKIFITGGEQDLTENIIHLVLARIPGAPEGPRGISMFVVPKILLNDDGSLGEPNNVSCGSIEHKMGVRGSATCVMNFDAATGFLVGEANMGLNYMFTMMNYERLGMGIQGVGAAQLSYQQAAAYAHDRLQGRAAGGARNTEKKADPIIVHADVRRMLLTMRSLTEAGRCFSLYVAKQLDIAKFSDEVAAKKRASALVALLTPVAKAFLTDMAYESCNLGQMILGGHGYIREWGQEQLVRDVRIAQIYEGTNGIQAMDLLGRKVVANSGAFLEIYCDEIRAFITAQEANEHTAAFLKPLADAVDKLEQVSEYIFAQVEDDPDIIGASAADYLAVVGHVSYAYMWALMLTASAQYQSDEAEAADDFCQSKNYVGQFYLQKILPRIDGLIQAIESGSDCIMTMPEELFN